MGLFDIFKKKEAPKPQNNPNSVFTLRFTVPYFQIFDKTDKDLSALPVKMSVNGSCQYRISDPDLCFDNVPLREMSPEQLEAHVKDALTMNIKTYFNSITTIPLLQFETMIAKISEATKARVTPVLNDEFGISLRAFSISGVRYDVEDPNYLRLQTISQKKAEARAKKVDATTDAEIDQIKTDSKLETQRKTNAVTNEQRYAELEIERKRKAYQHEHHRNEKFLDQELEIEKNRKEKELEAGFGAVDGISSNSDSSFDLSSIDDDFKL